MNFTLNLVSNNLSLREICTASEKDQWRVLDNKKRTVGFHTKGGILFSRRTVSVSKMTVIDRLVTVQYL